MPLKPQTSEELEFVRVLKSKHARYIDGVRIVDKNAVAGDFVPPGAVMGKITASGKYGPVTRDKVAAAGADSGANTIPLKNLNDSDWHNWQVGDSIAIKTATEAVAASLVTGVEGDDNALIWTAKDAGTAGNGISIELKNTAGSASLSVSLVGENDIVITLADDGTDPTSTAADIITAIEGDADCNAVVSVDNYGDSTGTGVVEAVAATNLSGGADASSELEIIETATISDIDETNGELTVDSISSNYAENTIVQKNDGSSVAEFVCLELIDVSEEDALVGGIVHGAVYSSAMPNYDELVAADLPLISFE